MKSKQPVSVVTGAAGFLGSHLTDLLLAHGHKVVGLDNFVTGNPANLAHLRGNKNFRFIKQDICEPISVSGPVNFVWNFASPASPIDYLQIPIATLKVGSFGTYQTLELARRKKARFLTASTSEVYGDPLVHPQTEDYWGNVNPIGLRSCYDEGKRVAETLMKDYHRQHNVDIRIARIFNTYGPRMLENDGRVVSNFIVQTLKGEEITIYGSGEQTRSFCYVDDLVDGLIRLMNVEGWHEPVNLGNPHEFTIKELAEQVAQVCGCPLRLRHEPLPQDDPQQRQPNIQRAQQLLAWQPAIQLREGLELTVAYFAQRLPERQFQGLVSGSNA